MRLRSRRSTDPGPDWADERDPGRRWVWGAGLLALLVGTVALVALAATRHPPASRSKGSTQVDLGSVDLGNDPAGSLAVVGDRRWRWTGLGGCPNSNTKTTTIDRYDAGSWTPVSAPLAAVRGLVFATATKGTALGFDAECNLAAATTTDGGRSWHADPSGSTLVTVGYAAGSSWVLTRPDSYSSATVQVTPAGASAPTSHGKPCLSSDGSATFVSPIDAASAWVLCQQGGSRLLVRSVNAGIDWQRETDTRPQTGFNGPGPVLRLQFVDGQRGFVLMPSATCPEGALRISNDSGDSWKQLPCPHASTALTAAYDVVFSSRAHGLLLGADGRKTVLLATDDGGHTWRPAG